MRRATICHVAEATWRALHVGFVDTPLVPSIRTAVGVDVAYAILTRWNVAPEPEVRGTAITGRFAHTVNRAFRRRFIGTALIPPFDTTLIVELANAILAPHVVAPESLVVGTAVSGRVASALRRTLGASLVDASLVPGPVAAVGVQVADTRLAT